LQFEGYCTGANAAYKIDKMRRKEIIYAVLNIPLIIGVYYLLMFFVFTISVRTNWIHSLGISVGMPLLLLIFFMITVLIDYLILKLCKLLILSIVILTLIEVITFYLTIYLFNTGS